MAASSDQELAPPSLDGTLGPAWAYGGMVSGIAANCISSSTLSSAAVRLRRRRPQRVQRWMSIQRRSPRTVTAIGSIPPGQSAFRSPGTLRSRCLDHRQLGQWLRWDVPGASSETSTPQCPHWNERGNGKSGDLSEQKLGPGLAFRLLSVHQCQRSKCSLAVTQRSIEYRNAPAIMILACRAGYVRRRTALGVRSRRALGDGRSNRSASMCVRTSILPMRRFVCAARSTRRRCCPWRSSPRGSPTDLPRRPVGACMVIVPGGMRAADSGASCTRSMPCRDCRGAVYSGCDGNAYG